MSQWTRTDVLALSDERDAHSRALLWWWRLGFAAGWAARGRVPRETLDYDEPGEWPVMVLGPLPPVNPKTDRLRYPPHGRARFGQPRRGDFKGGAVAPW